MVLGWFGPFYRLILVPSFHAIINYNGAKLETTLFYKAFSLSIVLERYNKPSLKGSDDIWFLQKGAVRFGHLCWLLVALGRTDLSSQRNWPNDLFLSSQWFAHCSFINGKKVALIGQLFYFPRQLLFHGSHQKSKKGLIINRIICQPRRNWWHPAVSTEISTDLHWPKRTNLVKENCAILLTRPYCLFPHIYT